MGEKMKKIILIMLITTMIMTMLVSSVSATLISSSADEIASTSILDAELLYYQPVPAQPGDTVDVYIQINNEGSYASKEGKIKIIDSNDLSAISDSDKIKSFSSIPAGESFLVKAKIKINKNANEGINNLDVEVQEDNSRLVLKKSFPITITGYTSSLSVLKTSSEPEVIIPGSEGTIKIDLKNVGDTKLRNIDFSLDLSDLDLAPIKSSNSKTIGELQGNSETSLEFKVTPYPDALSKTYQVPLTISYEDEQGNEKTQNEIIGVTIGSKPELMVYIDRVDLTTENKEGEITIKFVNKGLDKIKLLTMELNNKELGLNNNDFEIISSSNNIYVGDIDSDDYETAVINVKANSDNFLLPLKIKYKDSLNQPYEENLSLNVKLINGVGNGSNSFRNIVIIVIILILGWFGYKKYKKSKKKK